MRLLPAALPPAAAAPHTAHHPAARRAVDPGRVQVRRVPGPAPTPASVPALEAPEPVLRVALLPGVPAHLSARLPAGCALVPADHEDLDVAIAWVVDPDTVWLLRQRRPAVAVLALVPANSATTLVVRVLDAGADSCLRAADAREVTAHLLALERRRERAGAGHR